MLAVAVVVVAPQEVPCALTVQQWHRQAKSISQSLHPPLPLADLAMERAVAALEDKHRRDATNLLGQAHLVAATAQPRLPFEPCYFFHIHGGAIGKVANAAAAA